MYDVSGDPRHHLPEAVDSVLRVVKLDCRAGSQIQGPNGFLTLQQRHAAAYRYAQQARTTSPHNKPRLLWPEAAYYNISIRILEWNIQSEAEKPNTLCQENLTILSLKYLSSYLFSVNHLCFQLCNRCVASSLVSALCSPLTCIHRFMEG